VLLVLVGASLRGSPVQQIQLRTNNINNKLGGKGEDHLYIWQTEMARGDKYEH
jgi:hypothetical protein